MRPFSLLFFFILVCFPIYGCLSQLGMFSSNCEKTLSQIEKQPLFMLFSSPMFFSSLQNNEYLCQNFLNVKEVSRIGNAEVDIV